MKTPSLAARGGSCRAPARRSCSTRQMAVAGDSVVGTATLELENKATGRKVTTELWFKAAPDARIEWFSPRPPLRSIPIARNADPQPPLRKHPLIVVSHGNWGSRFSQGWLALELVKAGYVVLSTSHPGTVGDDQTVAGRYRLWDRSRDVSFALDEVLKNPKWAALIDAGPHRLRGSLLWRLDRREPRRRQVRSRSTESLLPERRDGRTSIARTRSRTISPACPRPTPETRSGMAGSRPSTSWVRGPDRVSPPNSLKSISAPFVVDTAQFDEILEPLSNSTNLARQIPTAREVVRPVGHFAYVPECRWLVGPILTRLAGLPLCDDPKGVDRALVHKQVAR